MKSEAARWFREDSRDLVTYDVVGLVGFLSVTVVMPPVGAYIGALVAFLLATFLIAQLIREIESRTRISMLIISAGSAALITVAVRATALANWPDFPFVMSLVINFSYWFVISLFLLLALPALTVERPLLNAKIAGGTAVSALVSAAVFPFVAFAGSFPMSAMPSVFSPMSPYEYLPTACEYKYYDAACFTLNPVSLAVDYFFWLGVISLVCLAVYQGLRRGRVSLPD